MLSASPTERASPLHSEHDINGPGVAGAGYLSALNGAVNGTSYSARGSAAAGTSAAASAWQVAARQRAKQRRPERDTTAAQVLRAEKRAQRAKKAFENFFQAATDKQKGESYATTAHERKETRHSESG